MESIGQDIRAASKRLFSEDKIDLLVGYEKGTIPLMSRPMFISNTEGADRRTDALVWNSFCTNNIAAYLQSYFENEPNRRKKREDGYPRIGVVVKGCDMRSVVALIKERQVVRDKLVLIGVPCRGMIDRHRVQKDIGDREIREYSESESGELTVVTKDGESFSFDREKVLKSACIECRYPVPEGVDFMIDGEARIPGDGGYERIANYENLTSEEKWNYFSSELSRCIRCNACRQACPTCWCKECFTDHTDLKWIGAGNDPTDAMVFQIIRIYHQAGRCVECDACYSACPMGIDLRTFTKKIVKDVEELFAYLPDFNTESLPPLTTFDEKDTNNFITDPEKG